MWGWVSSRNVKLDYSPQVGKFIAAIQEFVDKESTNGHERGKLCGRKRNNDEETQANISKVNEELSKTAPRTEIRGGKNGAKTT